MPCADVHVVADCNNRKSPPRFARGRARLAPPTDNMTETLRLLGVAALSVGVVVRLPTDARQKARVHTTPNKQKTSVAIAARPQHEQREDVPRERATMCSVEHIWPTDSDLARCEHRVDLVRATMQPSSPAHARRPARRACRSACSRTKRQSTSCAKSATRPSQKAPQPTTSCHQRARRSCGSWSVPWYSARQRPRLSISRTSARSNKQSAFAATASAKAGGKGTLDGLDAASRQSRRDITLKRLPSKPSCVECRQSTKIPARQ